MINLSRINRKLKYVNETIYYSYIKDRKIVGKDIRYGKDKNQYYKVYKNYKGKPTIFFVHGGGWWQGNPSVYSAVGKFFYKLGYTVVLTGYRLVPYYTYPTQIEDVFYGLNHYMRKNDTSKLIVIGYSAGGELSAHIVFDEDRQNKYNIDKNKIIGFISLSGVLDFRKCKSTYSKILIENYLTENKINKSNPIELIKKQSNIPILCIHGNKDSVIDVNTSISFVGKLKELNSNAQLKIIRNGEHEDTIDIVRGKGNKYTKELIDFISKLN